MSHINEHCKDCVNELGEEFREVHEWLDELSNFVDGIVHRRYRHNVEGVEEVRNMWGDKAARAAEIHILKDWFWRKQVPYYREFKDLEKEYYKIVSDMVH